MKIRILLLCIIILVSMFPVWASLPEMMDRNDGRDDIYRKRTIS